MSEQTNLGEQIHELKQQGYTYRQIKEQLGCSLGVISYHLGAGQKNKNLVRTRDRRSKIRKYIQEYKQSKPCADCGERYPYWVMDFDHLHGKKFNLGKYSNVTDNLAVIQTEVDKCDVVCANCHRNRTFSRRLRTGESTLATDT